MNGLRLRHGGGHSAGRPAQGSGPFHHFHSTSRCVKGRCRTSLRFASSLSRRSPLTHLDRPAELEKAVRPSGLPIPLRSGPGNSDCRRQVYHGPNKLFPYMVTSVGAEDPQGRVHLCRLGRRSQSSTRSRLS
jgi:hypothetical protein